MSVAARDGGGWRFDAPEVVGPLETLFARLLEQAADGAVVLGIDAPVGLPRAHAAQIGWATDFPAFLRGLAERPGFFDVCDTLDEAGPARPFYPRRGLTGMTRASHAAALGLDRAAMLRSCDRATATRPAAAALFWTLGPNQAGRAAISAWRDLLLPALLKAPDRLRLWPFHGTLAALASPGCVVVAETYPAEALRQLGLRLDGSKRRQADRARLAPGLLAALSALDAHPTPALRRLLEQGCGADAAGEDRFDSLLGLLCILRVLEGRQPEGPPACDPAEAAWLQHWEGWILGQQSHPSTVVDLATPGR